MITNDHVHDFALVKYLCTVQHTLFNQGYSTKVLTLVEMLKLASETNGTESGMEDAWLTLSVEGEPKGLEEDALEQSTFNEDLWHNLLDQLSKAEMCRINFEVEPYPPTDHGQVYCNRSWNGATCWPTTLAGHWATAFCPPEVEGVSLDVTQNATRYCHPNGMWNEKSNYDNCTLLSHVGIENLEEFEMVNLAARMIYFVGFSISSLALISALLIFSYFRSLHCLRNTIHSHLMGSFLLRILVWVMLHFVTRAVFLEPDIKDVSSGLNWFCKILTALSHYSTIANFFWMLMEGLYLHIMVFWVYSAEKLNIWIFALIGWCCPWFFVIIWAIAKYNKQNKDCWITLHGSSDALDFIIYAPNLTVIGVNLVFLFSIIWVLVSKINSSQNFDGGQYTKAVRATTLLVLLLGVAYIFFVIPPSNDRVTRMIFFFCVAVLTSLQGLCAAAFYCFMNGEVQATIKRRFHHWQDTRSISHGTRSTRVTSVTGRQSPTNGNSCSHPGTPKEEESKEIDCLIQCSLAHRESKDSNDNEKGKLSDNLMMAQLSNGSNV